jgi:hypothetical protein
MNLVFSLYFFIYFYRVYSETSSLLRFENDLCGSWKNITIGHYDSSTIRYELNENVDSCIKLILIGRLKMYSMKK